MIAQDRDYHAPSHCPRLRPGHRESAQRWTATLHRTGRAATARHGAGGRQAGHGTVVSVVSAQEIFGNHWIIPKWWKNGGKMSIEP